MIKDPVCNMPLKEPLPEFSAEYNGEVYHFCSSGCKERFEKNPLIFIESTDGSEFVKCRACQSQIKHPIYRDGKGPYCCEKCYFRDRFLGEVIDKVENIYFAIIESLVDAIDAKEHEVGNHSYRVAQLAMVLAEHMGIKGRALVDLYFGAILHDIGKIGIPDNILTKHEGLSKDEWEIMRKHPEIGYKIVSHIDFFKDAAEIIYCHHEHYDGSGYPRGLKGDEIVLGARIFAVCDTLDALTVERPYRKALSFEEAKEFIRGQASKQFDPTVVKHFLEVADRLKEFTTKIVF